MGGLTAGAKEVSLGERESGFGKLEAAKTAAQILSINADTISRFVMVLAIAGIFIWLNYEVMTLVEKVFTEELALLESGKLKATERSVNTQVFTALITATVVQTGVAIVAIVTYLFPKKPQTGG